MEKKRFSLFLRNGIYYVYFHKPDGSRTSPISTKERNRDAAVYVAEMLFQEKDKPQELEEANQPLKMWAERFFCDSCPHISRIRDEGRPYSVTTQKNQYAVLKNHLLPDPIMNKRLREITRGDILKFRDRLIESSGRRRTTQVAYAALRVIFSEAEFRQIIDRSPCRGIGQIKYEEKRRSAFSLEQLSDLLQPDFYADPLCFEMTLCAATTGMRAGEVRALQWKSLDPDKKTIKIVSSMSPNSSAVSPPKWHKFRTAPYPAILQDRLEKRRASPDTFVFATDRGVVSYNRWRDAFERAAKALQVESATLHGLRHSLATHLREAGVGDEHIRAVFGWSNVGIQENYTHRELYSVQSHLDAVKKLIGG